MKPYEIYCEEFSAIIHDVGVTEAVNQFCNKYPKYNPICVEDVEARNIALQEEKKAKEDFYPGSRYQKLFTYLYDNGFIALQSEMDEIIHIVNKCFRNQFADDLEEIEYKNRLLDLHCEHILNYDGRGKFGNKKLQRIADIVFSHKLQG